MLTLIALNFHGTSFSMLTFERGLKFCGSMYYFVFAIVVGLYIIMVALGISRKAAKLEAKEKAFLEKKKE